MPFPVVAAAAAVKVAKTLFGDAHPKDKIRYQRNEWLANMAANGDGNAFAALGVLSRRKASPEPNGYSAGPLPDGWISSAPAGKKWDGSQWGWATSETADDAWKKYQALEPFFVATGGTSGNGSTVGNPSAPSPGVFKDTQPQAPFTYVGDSTSTNDATKAAGGAVLGLLALGIGAAYFLKGRR